MTQAKTSRNGNSPDHPHACKAALSGWILTAGTGATGTGGDSLLGAEETRGRRYAKAPVDEGAPGG